MKKVLLLGSGTSREKKLAIPGTPRNFDGCELITIDMDPNCKPTILWDFDEHKGLPPHFDPDTIDEIHAYDSLEHWGKQGDWRGWFAEMEAYWKMLKVGGHFFIIVPTGEDRFTDPGHTRFISTNYFHVMSERFYKERAARGEHGGDYRWYWKYNFNVLACDFMGGPEFYKAHHLAVLLEKAPCV